MKILLLGEYSNLHWTLAEGLKTLGHEVVVASDGDGFKNHTRDIDLFRNSSNIPDTFKAIKKVYQNLNNFKNYDIVQLINPCFTSLNVEINKYLYRFLRKNNKKIFLGAFGDDAYWLKACLDKKTFRYSEFYIGDEKNNLAGNEHIGKIWKSGGRREKLNSEIAKTCDGIIACLYEYYVSYKPFYQDKLTYIPLPVNLSAISVKENRFSDKIRFFIGINKTRTQFKGTDRFYKMLIEVKKKYSHRVEIHTIESIPYNQYIDILENSDVVLDQLYSYSPAMNGLLALAKGKVLVSGGESEMYDLLKEDINRPIINVLPFDSDIIEKLEKIILEKDNIPVISGNGRKFVQKHHDHIKVAKQYLDFWQK